MRLFNALSILVSLAALLSFVNHRYLRLPTTIGLMFLTLVGSIGLIAVSMVTLDIRAPVAALVSGLDFEALVLKGMLGFLLFAGALHVKLSDLERQRGVIAVLASVGVIASTFMVGYLVYWGQELAGLEIPLIYCLLFGALISPTDPIAVLGVLKTAGAPNTLATKITGESLFNDGIGVVVFIALLGFVGTGHGADPEFVDVLILFLKEAVGGALFGLAIGYAAYSMLKKVDDYRVEVLITLALVMGGYALAMELHTSGPIAMVVAGLLIGNHGRRLAMSDETSQRLDTFWELVDEVLNAVLFVLIGLEVLVLAFSARYLMAGLLAVPLVLLVRFLCVGVTVKLFKPWRNFTPHAIKLMTWGGLRGGISVALALTLPRGPERELVLAAAYAVVVFSIVVQGLSIGPIIRKLKLPKDDVAEQHQG